jgi:hypothetical protein
MFLNLYIFNPLYYGRRKRAPATKRSVFLISVHISFYLFIKFSDFKKPDTVGQVADTKPPLLNTTYFQRAPFEKSPKNAYVLKFYFLGKNVQVLEFSTYRLTPSQSFAPIGTAGYFKP